MKKFLVPLALGAFLVGCSNPTGINIKTTSEGFKLYIDGIQTYINGVGGTNRLDIATKSGANAFRTWGGNIEGIKKNLKKAAEHNMYVMQGISMTKDSAMYHNNEYKNKKREEVRLLATTFKDDTSLLSWGIGNEIDLGNANTAAAWSFVEELAQLIKSIDKKHLVSTVISYKPAALDSIAKYAPSLDYVGINVYGPMNEVKNTVAKSSYKGPYMITEWGPTGWWETATTSWKAPIEQTSEEKRQVYEDRYTKYIKSDSRCLGSFVFLWGQKEERTPTWFSMFVENNVEGLPLKGESTPMVEAMQRVWTGKEPTETAPIINSFMINGKQAIESIKLKCNESFKAVVNASDKEEKNLIYIWEILNEATVLGFGGSYEPRPERAHKVLTTEINSCDFTMDKPGNYRLYVYVLDNTGFASTVNIPFQVY